MPSMSPGNNVQLLWCSLVWVPTLKISIGEQWEQIAIIGPMLHVWGDLMHVLLHCRW